jgi:hypothetical protein
MLLLPPLNCVLGILCGIRHRVFIVLPLAALAFVEVFFIGIMRGGTWISVTWKSLGLIACIQTGYLIGAALAYLFPVSALRHIQRPVLRYIAVIPTSSRCPTHKTPETRGRVG